MTRGSTPTFVFTLPSDTSVYSDIDIDIYFAQNGSVILDVTQAALTLSGNEVSFTMTEEESLKFTASVPAEIQIRLVTKDGRIFISEIRRIAVLKRYPLQ